MTFILTRFFISRSPLIRTIWSVLDRSSAEYLQEIILVDDASDKNHLKVKINLFAKYLVDLYLILSFNLYLNWIFKLLKCDLKSDQINYS